MGGRAIHTAAELHQQAVAETERGRHAVGRRLLLRALRAGPDPELRVHILISLAYHTAERRGLADGLDLLRQADEAPELPRRLRGLVASQRALLLMRAGAATEAVAHFDTALRLLPETQPEDVGRALLNRGYIAMQQRRYAPARADFASCVELARRHGLTLLGAKASHNLGYLWSLFGDLPRALREMDAVAPVLTSQSPAHVATYHVDRAQVLLAAGLFREADEDLARAAELFRAAGVRQDQAEAELTRAQVALSEQRWSDARQLAVLARRRFTGRGATGWALLAAYVAVAARVGQKVRPQAAAAEAEALAQRLEEAGLYDDARRARLTAAQAALARSRDVDVSWAETLAGDALRLRRHDPLATRLHARTVRAQLAEATGASGRASRERRAGLAELHRYQASFGSMDLRTAASAHGRQLATDGLARALADNQPASVFQWAEETRALSARLPPVLPPADEQAAQMLEELRDARMELRKQSIAGQVDPQLRARCLRLEQRIRQRSWYTPGQGHAVAPAPLSALRAELAASGGTFVAHLICDQRLYALVVTGQRQRLQPLGPAGEVVETHLRLRRDLDALALSHLPEPVRASVRSASRTALRRLDEWLWKPLRGRIGDGPLLLAPAAELTAVPWTLLPALRGRPVTVTASVTAWLGRRQGQQLPADPVAALAAGPGVLRAMDEIRLVAKVWSAPEPDRESTTEQVRRAAGSADVLHVAAHGTHEPENPLFSHLDLVDGPLFGHELKQLSRLPAHVVLSACELGRAGTRPGGETLGMTAALLHGGAGSVVAGVARITDLVAYQIGPAHHAGLRQGLSPAAALASAIDGLDPDADPAPLVCFGAGW